MFSADAEADRSFLAEIFGCPSVDAGGGRSILDLPPAELAVHLAEAPAGELYLMTDDLAAEMESLTRRGAVCSVVEEAR